MMELAVNLSRLYTALHSELHNKRTRAKALFRLEVKISQFMETTGIGLEIFKWGMRLMKYRNFVYFFIVVIIFKIHVESHFFIK